MSTLFLDSDDPVVEAALARRRELGQDGRDEVWEGVYHVAPSEHGRNGRIAALLLGLLVPAAAARGLHASTPFNLGSPDDYRVPDLGLLRSDHPALWNATAALVAEVRSPRDETFAKLPFYAARGVEEVWVLDPAERTLRIWQLRDSALVETGTSGLLDLTADGVQQSLPWPEG